MEGTDTLSRAQVISAAAAPVLRGRGYASVGIDEIAAAAGLTGPALYRYFDGKHEVLVEVVARFVDQLAELEPDLDPGQLATLIAQNPDAASVSVRQFGLIDSAVRRELLDAAPAHVRSMLPITGEMSTQRRVRLRALYGAAIHCGLKHGTTAATRVRWAVRVGELLWRAPLDIGPLEPRPRRRLLPVSKREAIMAVASDLFSQHGYGGVTLRDIGAELEVTASAVTKHFASKEDVLEALFERASHQIGAALQSALRRASDPADALARILRGYSEMATGNRELIIIFSSERNSLSATNREHRRAHQLGYVTEVRRLLTLTVPGLSRTAALIRSTLVFSAINEVLFDEEACAHRDLAAALAELARHTIIAPPLTVDRAGQTAHQTAQAAHRAEQAAHQTAQAAHRAGQEARPMGQATLDTGATLRRTGRKGS